MGKKNGNKEQSKKSQVSDSKKNTMVVGALLVIVLGYWAVGQFGGSDYPSQVSGTFYGDAVVSPETGRVTVPKEVVAENKLVFVDIKLDAPVESFTYLGREIILTSYRGGEYLPLVIIETPKGKTFSGVRTCEPCNGFSFHILDGKYLSCDTCGTRWDIETLQGISGGCMNYPPPKLTTGLLNGIVIEAGATGLDLQI